MLPPGARLAFLGRSVERKYRAQRMTFPYDMGPSRRVLIILPLDPVTALHQITGVASLVARYAGVHVSVVSEKRITPFFRAIAGIAEFIEYDRDEHYLFSPAFDAMGKKIHTGKFDVCLMLESSPDSALLYMAGQSAAALRVGLAGAGEYPFLNLHVKPSPGLRYLTDRGLLVASVLGVPRREKPGWSVTRESADEARTMLHERGLDHDPRLVGIDAPSFLSRFGGEWVRSLVDGLKARPCSCYLFSWERPGDEASEWMAKQGLPVFADLPVSRAAALLALSELVVAGRGVMFELADLLRRPVVGLFPEEEFDSLCRETETTRGLRIPVRPDEATLALVGRMLDARLQPGPKGA
jgi:ADP-heptose:LPS heptosyltransferase